MVTEFSAVPIWTVLEAESLNQREKNGLVSRISRGLRLGVWPVSFVCLVLGGCWREGLSSQRAVTGSVLKTVLECGIEQCSPSSCSVGTGWVALSWLGSLRENRKDGYLFFLSESALLNKQCLTNPPLSTWVSGDSSIWLATHGCCMFEKLGRKVNTGSLLGIWRIFKHEQGKDTFLEGIRELIPNHLTRICVWWLIKIVRANGRNLAHPRDRWKLWVRSDQG